MNWCGVLALWLIVVIILFLILRYLSYYWFPTIVLSLLAGWLVLLILARNVDVTSTGETEAGETLAGETEAGEKEKESKGQLNTISKRAEAVVRLIGVVTFLTVGIYAGLNAITDKV